MNKRRVLLFNDNAKRDLLGIRMLESALNRRGVLTKICNPQNARVRLLQFRPHAFIAARADHAIAREASKICKVFVVPGEGATQTKETMLTVFMGRGYWKLDSVDWLTRCYLWSERTKEWLIDTGLFDSKQLKVVGNPRLDLYRDTGLVSALTKKDGSFRLGVAFSAGATSTYYGHPHYAKAYYDMHPELTFPITQPGRHYEDIVWRDHAILRNMMRCLRAYLENGENELWLRPSPFESPNEYNFLQRLYPGRVKVLPNQTLPEFLCGVDAILTSWSTLGLEGLLLQKPVISISGLLDQEHLFRHISPKAGGFETFAQFYHQPKSEAALWEILDQARAGVLPPSSRDNSEVKKLLHDSYAWPGSKPTSELIAEDIVQEITNDPDKSQKEWKQKLPLRYPVPLPLASVLVALRTIVTTVRSGEFKAYRDFLRTSDPAVESLLGQMTVEIVSTES